MGKKKNEIKNTLSSDFSVVNDWFHENVMVLNPEKSHFRCLGKNIDETGSLSVNDLALKNGKEVKNLGINLDNSMGFNTHIRNICRKAGQKISDLLRISPHLNQGKKFL